LRRNGEQAEGVDDGVVAALSAGEGQAGDGDGGGGGHVLAVEGAHRRARHAHRVPGVRPLVRRGAGGRGRGPPPARGAGEGGRGGGVVDLAGGRQAAAHGQRLLRDGGREGRVGEGVVAAVAAGGEGQAGDRDGGADAHVLAVVGGRRGARDADHVAGKGLA